MDAADVEAVRRLNKKNKLSAELFLISPILGGILTAAAIFICAILIGTIDITIDVAMGSYSRNTFQEKSQFLEASKQLWLFWGFYIISALAQIMAGIAMLKKAKWARKAGIITIAITVLTITPVVILQFYALVFLLGDQGKWFYSNIEEIKKYGVN